MNEETFSVQRQQMVHEIMGHSAQLAEDIEKGTLAARVLEAMAKVPRHEFVPVEIQAYAYANSPLPIGYGKTISQPFIVALMTDLLDLQETDIVLEIGTGFGYQAAILAELAHKVYSVEILDELAVQARNRLGRLGYDNIETCVANGYHGWAEHALFDKIMVTAAPELIPPPLINQLKPGGRMAVPAGLQESQQLLLVDKGADGRVTTQEILAVRFSQLEEAGPPDSGAPIPQTLIT